MRNEVNDQFGDIIINKINEQFINMYERVYIKLNCCNLYLMTK